MTLLLTVAGGAIKRSGFDAPGQFVMYMGFFTALQVSMLFTYLKEQPTRVKVVMTGLPLAVVAAILATSIWIAAAT